MHEQQYCYYVDVLLMVTVTFSIFATLPNVTLHMNRPASEATSGLNIKELK